jgi:hemoglobin/transferrin/lactoferrin receptor protein
VLTLKSFRLKYSIFALITFWTGILSAQIAHIRDAETGEPLEWVSILSRNPEALLLTNREGEVELSSLRDAKKIEISLLGYSTQIKSYSELQADSFEVSLVKGAFNIEQVVISATRWRQPSRESPQKITSIPIQDVRLLNPATTADLLGSSGQVFVQKSQLGGGSPMIRGFSTNRLLYSVDGIRMNTAIFRSGNLHNVISLDPFAIESTEVLFGPGSVLYGSDAIGAVMSFETLKPEFSLRDKPIVSVSASGRTASAAKERTGHADLHLGWQRWALVSSFTYSRFDDLLMGEHGPKEYWRNWYVDRINNRDTVIANPTPSLQIETGYKQMNVMQKVAHKPGDDWLIEYAFHYSETGDIPRYDRLILEGDSLPVNAEWYYGPQVWMMNQLSINQSKSNSIFDEMSIKLAHQNFKESRNDRRFQSELLRVREEEVLALSANVDFIKSLSLGSRIYYGIEYVFNEVTSVGNRRNIITGESNPIISRYPNSTWQSYAAYGSLQADLNDELVFQTGLRWNGFNLYSDFSNNEDFTNFDFSEASLQNSSITGSAGLNWRPGQTWNIRTNVSTGFRAPNVDDIGKIFDQPDGTVVIPNPELNSEYATNFEVGFSKVFRQFLRIEATAYYTNLSDAMVRRDFSSNGNDSIIYDGELRKVQAIQNAARAWVYGFQFGLELKLNQYFSLNSVYNIQNGEEETNDSLSSPL